MGDILTIHSHQHGAAEHPSRHAILAFLRMRYNYILIIFNFSLNTLILRRRGAAGLEGCSAANSLRLKSRSSTREKV